MINIGIVGIGDWGKNYIKTLAKSNKAQITSFYSTGNLENKEWVEKNYPKISYKKKVDDLLSDESINAAIIATPTDTHFNFALKFLNAGKHVLVEKPPAKNEKDFQKLVKAAHKNKRVFLVDNIFLYNEAFVELEQRISNEKLQIIVFDWQKYGSFKGDILWELVYHELYQAQKLAGKVNKSEITYSESKKTDRDTISLKVETQKCPVYIDINRVSNFKQHTLVAVCKDNTYMLFDNTLFKYSKYTSILEEIFKSNTPPLNLVLKDFIDRIKKSDFEVDHNLTQDTMRALSLI